MTEKMTRAELFDACLRETGSIRDALILSQETEKYLENAALPPAAGAPPPHEPVYIQERRRRWTAAERQLAAEHLDNGCGIELTAAELGRTVRAIQKQLYDKMIVPKVYTGFATRADPKD